MYQLGVVQLVAQDVTQGAAGPSLFSFENLPQFFDALFKTAIVLGAILAVIRLGYAGFIYMTTDVWTHKETAKTIIQEAVLGLLLLLSIWIILNQINPQILNLDILRNVTPASQQPTSP